MEKTSDREALMIRYLLGQLPEEEQVRLEQEFFTDEESYHQLLALEDELRYDYATGELSGREREQFKERFLVTPEDRRKVAFATALISKVAPPAAAVRPEATATPAGHSWWQQFASLLMVQNPIVRYSFAAAALVVVLGLAWLISQQFRTTGPQELAEQPPQAGERQGQTNEAPVTVSTPPKEVVVEQRPPQQSPTSEPAKQDELPVPNIATFLLTPGLVRGGSEPKELVIDRDTKRVRLVLSLKKKSEHGSYRAVLRTLEGAEVWSRSGLSSRRTGAGQSVLAQLPTSLLAGGDYELVLQGATSSGDYEDVDEYYFRIVKK